MEHMRLSKDFLEERGKQLSKEKGLSIIPVVAAAYGSGARDVILSCNPGGCLMWDAGFMHDILDVDVSGAFLHCTCMCMWTCMHS